MTDVVPFLHCLLFKCGEEGEEDRYPPATSPGLWELQRGGDKNLIKIASARGPGLQLLPH